MPVVLFFSQSIPELKDHYCGTHAVEPSNSHFLDLFESDTLDRKCTICSAIFPTCRNKKNHMFLSHYNQRGGAGNAERAPLNISRRGHITYYSVNFRQHGDCYDFHSSDMVDVFLDVVHQVFVPQRNILHKFQAYFEIVNHQRIPDNDDVLTDKRVWFTNVFVSNILMSLLGVRLKIKLLRELLTTVRVEVVGTLRGFTD